MFRQANLVSNLHYLGWVSHQVLAAPPFTIAAFTTSRRWWFTHDYSVVERFFSVGRVSLAFHPSLRFKISNLDRSFTSSDKIFTYLVMLILGLKNLDFLQVSDFVDVQFSFKNSNYGPLQQMRNIGEECANHISIAVFVSRQKLS